MPIINQNANQNSYHPSGITNKNYITVNRKLQRVQTNNIINSSNNKQNIQKNQKQKVNNIQQSGNLFKQIGEVISNSHQNELANLLYKISNLIIQNFLLNSLEQNPMQPIEVSKTINRPKSITYRK